MTDKEVGTRGISVFIVEKEQKVLTLVLKKTKWVSKGLQLWNLFLEIVEFLKKTHLVKKAKALSMLCKTLDGGRIGIASTKH